MNNPLSLIPSSATPEFYALAKRNQNNIRNWLSAMEIISESAKVTTGIANAAKAFAGVAGMSEGRIRARYYEWAPNKDWRVFINYAFEPQSRKQPDEFIEHFRMLCEQNQRSTSQAVNQLKRQWRAGETIPGYGTWREWFHQNHPGHTLPRHCTIYPRGWTTRNLRRYTPTKYELKAVRIGRSAAASHRRLVYTTRADLYVGAVYQFDDMWHDLMVACTRENKAGRPLELFSHDLYSARKMRWGFRVRVKDGNRYKGLTESMTRSILAATLALDGYSPRGTILTAENGTAAISERIEQILYDATGGLITIARAPMEGAPTHDGLYAGRGKGNFRIKASLESLNSLTHNAFGHIPAQTGKDIAHRPEQLHGLLKNTDDLLKAMAQLPPEVARTIQLPLLTAEQFYFVAHEIYQQLDHRIDHNLEGWAQNMVAEYQLGHEWINQTSMLALPPAQQQLAMGLLQGGQLTTRTRRLSPWEVWQAGSPHLTQIHPAVVCDILGPDLATERTVRSNMIEFLDSDISPDPLRYDALIHDRHGREQLLRDGEKYLAFINPFAPDQLYLQDAQGRFIGIASRVQSVCKTNMDALHRAMGEASKRESLALAPVRARHAAQAREKADRHRHNTAILDAPRIARQAREDAAEQALQTVTTQYHDPDEHDYDDEY